MVNGGKLYPKAISMKLEDELKYDNRSSRSSKSTKSSRSSRKSPKIVQGPGQTFGLDSAFETASTVSSKVTDNTLEYGDWQIMEPGNNKI